ncbi:prepilin-type N-terminal cleavage/methylation domain-containing protein [Clostridium rectalis]|uniref:prepilin-type N-terminal cleavage/methylation domain-containing protein n=1 Tax=Clostridium rectalis TaxID=2040295 RepID=UPI0013DE254A|nr:prepilin-type N-terminal cleavage/methylation domain-containing protein [Clostridium rectalis]
MIKSPIKFKKIKKCQKAFTLTEIIIVVGILSLLIAATYSINNSITHVFNKKINDIYSQEDTKVAIRWMKKDIEVATEIKKEKDLYIIKNKEKTIEYIIKKGKKIKGEDVATVFRKDGKEKFVLFKNVLYIEKGFNITQEKDNIVKIDVIIKDKFNKDKKIVFTISNRLRLCFHKEDPNKPFIDINNDGILNGEDYNITFDEKGMYHWEKDSRYVKGVLVFPGDFIVENRDITCIVKDGVRIKENVNLKVLKGYKMKIQTKKVWASKSNLEIYGDKNQDSKLEIDSSSLDINYANIKVQAKGNEKASGNLKINSKDIIEKNYCNIIAKSEKGASCNIDINTKGNIKGNGSSIIIGSKDKGKNNININTKRNIKGNGSSIIIGSKDKGKNNININSLGTIYEDKSIIVSESESLGENNLIIESSGSIFGNNSLASVKSEGKGKNNIEINSKGSVDINNLKGKGVTKDNSSSIKVKVHASGALNLSNSIFDCSEAKEGVITVITSANGAMSKSNNNVTSKVLKGNK